jgi:type III secretory pathway component EscU
MVLSYNRRTSYAIFITTIVVLEMVLIIEHIKPTNALKKLLLKKALKKLAPLISLLQLLKSKKKVIPIPLPLPLPIPM